MAVAELLTAYPLKNLGLNIGKALPTSFRDAIRVSLRQSLLQHQTLVYDHMTSEFFKSFITDLWQYRTVEYQHRLEVTCSCSPHDGLHASELTAQNILP